MSVVIDTHCERSVGWIRLNSPESANALGKQDMSRLAARISELGSEKTVRALVITGEGASFSAGAALGDLNGADKDDVTSLMVAQMSAIHSALRECPVATIMALNGPAVGAGAGIALLGDFIFMADTARLAFPFARLGLVPDTGLTQSLPIAIGMTRSRAVLMSGGTLSAEECREIGVAAGVFPREAFAQEVQERAEDLAKMPTGIHYEIRQLLQTREASAHRRLQAEATIQAGRFANEETRAVIEAIVKKRTKLND